VVMLKTAPSLFRTMPAITVGKKFTNSLTLSGLKLPKL